MEIKNSDIKDITRISELYRIASDYKKSKNQGFWPEFPRALIVDAIEGKRQWKISIEHEIACIWTTRLNDELIWGKDKNTPSVYIHRIATSPDFRGQRFVKNIVNWADDYCNSNDLKFIRMDTVGLNEGLIKHYKKFGFDFLGTKELENTVGLPDHYNKGLVCLFQREVKIKAALTEAKDAQEG